jgi:outer membrane lipoprotein-sorting protein
MKNILKYLVYASIIFNFQFSFFNLSQAQITHNSQGRLDENATAVLKKAIKKLENASFSVNMTILDGQKKKVFERNAEVRYLKSSYRLKSSEEEFYCDGTTVWYWNKKAKELTISSVEEDDGMNLLNPASLMAHIGENFRAKYIRTEDDGTAVIDLQPRSAQSFHKIRLFINEKNGELKSIEVHKYDSGREIYLFSKQQYGKEKMTGFTFDPKAHPDVEVIDMR